LRYTISVKKDEKSAPVSRPETETDAPLFDPAAKAAPARTFGLRAVDVGLYGGLNNFTVGASSIFFTYLTNRGSKFGKAGSAARWFGERMEKRGDLSEDWFRSMGLSAKFACEARMVFWSFFDGTTVLPAVKVFEDNRGNIAKRIDTIVGTRPADDSVYDAEPKQSWGSVLGGRALTALIVVPTASFLNKIDLHKGSLKWAIENGPNLNERAFTRPGVKLGEYISKNHPKFTQKFSKEAFEEMAKVSIFESFYTSVCTVGLFFTSRWLAGGTQHAPANRNYAPQPDDTNVVRLKNLMQERPEKTVDAQDAEHEAPKEAALAK
jgi:hypothetical protein